MQVSILGFTEFFIVLLFALGWLILELVGRRLDRQRTAWLAAEKRERDSETRSG